MKLGHWAEEATSVLAPRATGYMGFTDNQMVGSTIKSSSNAAVVRKHRTAPSTSREKVLTASPNANRADSSKRTRGTAREAREREEWQEEAEADPPLRPGHHL